MEVEEDIKEAIALLEQNDENFHPQMGYGKFYIRTNEPLSYYYPHFKVKDAKIITVTGSGDHLLQAALEGAKEVVSFDVNPLTYYLTSLKLTAIETMDLKTYCRFFEHMKTMLNEEGFDFLCPYLKDDVRLFWESLYKEKDFFQNRKYLCYFPMNYFASMKTFLQPQNYVLLQEQLKNVQLRFMTTDLFDLPFVLEKEQGTFDTIFLSNIFDWLNKKQVKAYPNFIKEELAPLLKEDGKCVVYSGLYDYYFPYEMQAFETVSIESKKTNYKVFMYTKK